MIAFVVDVYLLVGLGIIAALVLAIMAIARRGVTRVGFFIERDDKPERRDRYSYAPLDPESATEEWPKREESE